MKTSVSGLIVVRDKVVSWHLAFQCAYGFSNESENGDGEDRSEISEAGKIVEIA